MTDQPLPSVVAHRGASGRHPENTLRAFRAAVSDGADFLECDVRATADGVPVIFHDAELDRLSGRGGRVEDLTHADARKLRIRIGPAARPRGEPLPSLDDLAKVARGRAKLVVEIKAYGPAPALVRAVVRCLRRFGHRDAAIISFSAGVVDGARRRERWPLVGLILGSGTKPAVVRRALARPEPLLVVQKSLAKDAVIRAAHAREKALWTYAVDGIAEQRRFAARGIDGIITNFPDRARRALAPMRASRK